MSIWIAPERIRRLNTAAPRRGKYVLYWMQQSQRARSNHALEYAVQVAEEHDAPVLVVFGLMDDYPEANLRHYRFMLEGLQAAQEDLRARKIQLAVVPGNPAEVAVAFAKEAIALICDMGYLRHQKAWRAEVAKRSACPVIQIEADVVVPVEAATDKAEYAARTIRPKLQRLHEEYLIPLAETSPTKSSLGIKVDGLDLRDLDKALAVLKLDTSVPPVPHLFTGGTAAAEDIFQRFLKNAFRNYQENRNQPQTEDVSHMSKYLHFGQISPLWLALQARGAKGVPEENKQSFLEELLIRRELAHNFVHFTRDYDKFHVLPRWAQDTLDRHRDDPREHLYSQKELEAAQTHDRYWNAAMKEMRDTGYMHNYMRMYWGKKIIEWSATPEAAYKTALTLNNKYFLDGRDPNGYTNVAWLFGLHDRPWQERPIFGTIRYMAASGLERKCDIEGYVRRIEGSSRQLDLL